jgi:hypothetical protein
MITEDRLPLEPRPLVPEDLERMLSAPDRARAFALDANVRAERALAAGEPVAAREWLDVETAALAVARGWERLHS